MRYQAIEIKSFEENGTVEGYGAVFGNKDAYGDILQPEAFEKTLQKQQIENIKMLWQHRPSEPIGIWEDIHTDRYGLYAKGRLLLDVAQAREAHALLKAGAINGLSIGYTVESERWDDARNSNLLEKINLREISIVTFPANKLATLASVKNERDHANYKRHIERVLRDSGLSKKEAQTIVSGGVPEMGAVSSDGIQAVESLILSLK